MPHSVFDRSQYFGHLNQAVQQRGYHPGFHPGMGQMPPQRFVPQQQTPQSQMPLAALFAQHGQRQQEALPPGIVGQVPHLPPGPPIAQDGAAIAPAPPAQAPVNDGMPVAPPPQPVTAFGTTAPPAPVYAPQMAIPAPPQDMPQAPPPVVSPPTQPWAAPNPTAPPLQQQTSGGQGDERRKQQPGSTAAPGRQPMPKPADFMGPLRAAAGGQGA